LPVAGAECHGKCRAELGRLDDHAGGAARMSKREAVAVEPEGITRLERFVRRVVFLRDPHAASRYTDLAALAVADAQRASLWDQHFDTFDFHGIPPFVCLTPGIGHDCRGNDELGYRPA